MCHQTLKIYLLSFLKPAGCSGCETGYTVTCSQAGMHYVSKKQWDQSPSFSQVFKEVEAQC